MTTKLNADTPLSQWLTFLEHGHGKAIDLGLDRVASVVEKLDLLHPAPFVITVGGTNGKGTTCHLLELILLNAGLRVGVYSSPHLLRYNERVRIQNKTLPDSEHSRSFDYIEKHKDKSLSYFEFSTLSALHIFKRAQLDVVILEVGLGGRLDATNAIDSNLAVITSIDIDHTEYLGNTREDIAYEKAGIFRNNEPVIIGEPDIPQSMLNEAEKHHCQLACRDKNWQFSVNQEAQTWSWRNNEISYTDLPLPNIPVANAATALAAIPYLPFCITEEGIRQALQDVELDGRFQRIKDLDLENLAEKLTQRPEKLPSIILDVGHNPHAAKYVSERLKVLKGQRTNKIFAICGVLKDKDTKGVLAPLMPFIDRWFCISLEGERGQTGASIAKIIKALSIEQDRPVFVDVERDIVTAVKNAVSMLHRNDILLIFGSFLTVGSFLELLEKHDD